ncbi:MAG: hypothetical protein ACLFPE_08585 [Bacteroidales bacterium]
MRSFFLVYLCLSVVWVSGQESTALPADVQRDSIFIHADVSNNQNVFIIDSIMLQGNKTTRRHIILRELTFKTGDTIPAFLLAKNFKNSRDNLLNTSLFNFVTVYDSVISSGHFIHLDVKIHFVERWYIWPFPILELSDRNFNTWWKEKDFGRLSYGLFLKKENVRGRMETLWLLARFGYDEKYQLGYDIPYINRQQTFGAGIGAGWSQNHEVAYQTVDNKLQHVNTGDEYLFKNYYSYLRLTHRPTLYHHHLLQLNYNYYVFGDTVLKLNPNYSFGNEEVNEYLNIFYRFTIDHRDSKVYPLNGSYFMGALSRSGFGVLKNGDISMMELLGSYQKYWKLKNRFHLASDWSGKFSTVRDQPYFYQRGLGYDRNFVRGYELYVIDGQSFILSKNTVKFTLLPTRVTNIDFINSEKFAKIHYTIYLNWFLDVGYVEAFRNSETNDLSNTLLIGTGFGIDLVTYYDLVIRVEASVNGLGEPGVFLHFKNTL